MEEISFTAKESAKLGDMVKLFEATKAVILFAEEVADDHMALPQITKELRDTLDHMMRVIAYKVGVRGQVDSQYGETNLDKAFGHLYRAAYDALDWLSIVLRHRITMQLSKYSCSAIEAALPDYYTLIKPRLDSAIPGRIADIRGRKDVGAPNIQSIEEYADLVKDLKNWWEKVVGAEASLMDYAKRERGGRRRDHLVRALIGAGGAALAAILTWIICQPR